MKAARFHEFGGSIKIEEVADPEPASDQVLIRVAACQMGGDVLKIMAGGGAVRDPEAFVFPHTPGYRGAGVIESVGSSVHDLTVGDRVVINGFYNCGECEFCSQGWDNLCERSHMLGIDSGLPGAVAERVAVPATAAFVLPDDLSFQRATLLPNAALLVHAYRRGDISGPFTVAIFGCGLVGGAAAVVAKALGATQIIGVDNSPAALDQIRACGADTTIDATNQDPVSAILAATDGRGVDVAVEGVGVGGVIADAVRSVRRRGTALLIGALGETTISFPYYYRDVIQREINILTCFGKGRDDFATAVEMAADGRLDLSPFPVKSEPFDDIAAAVEQARRPDDADVHVVTFE